MRGAQMLIKSGVKKMEDVGLKDLDELTPEQEDFIIGLKMEQHIYLKLNQNMNLLLLLAYF